MPSDVPPGLRGRTTAEAMLRRPLLLDAGSTVADLHRFFADDHVHAALVVDGDRLLTVVDRADLPGLESTASATDAGTLADRTVGAADDLASTWTAMVAAGRRRVAVVDGDRLLGLLCLKRSGRGFCTDADVAARAGERDPEVVNGGPGRA